MKITVYGIKNCDTVKKTLKHLDKKGVDYNFFDFKKEPIEKKHIDRWKKSFGDWPVNQKGRTYKQMKEEFAGESSPGKIRMIQENTSLIKRPILENDKEVLCFGYDAEVIEELF